jgi:FixJ family two-component response regulator
LTSGYRGVGGLDFQAELAKAKIHIPIIFITGHGDIPMSVKAMKAGAVEFLTKPFRDQELLDAIQVAPNPPTFWGSCARAHLHQRAPTTDFTVLLRYQKRIVDKPVNACRQADDFNFKDVQLALPIYRQKAPF